MWKEIAETLDGQIYSLVPVNQNIWLIDFKEYLQNNKM